MSLKNTGIVSLEDVLAYTNHDVVYSFMEKFDIPYEEADSIFYETKKWLWACYYCNNNSEYADVSMVIEDSILIIDKMWHTFILFTRPYHNFCNKYFSTVIHHSPTTYKEKQLFKSSLRTNRIETLSKKRDKQERMLSYIYDTLGKPTIIKWYVEYRKKYTPESILAMRKM